MEKNVFSFSYNSESNTNVLQILCTHLKNNLGLAVTNWFYFGNVLCVKDIVQPWSKLVVSFFKSCNESCL